MADNPTNLENKEAAPEAVKPSKNPDLASPQGVDSSRMDIAGTLEAGAEEGGESSELMDTGEKVSEVSAEGREKKGDGIKKGGKQQIKKDDGKKGDDGQIIFDETNLPPAPLMIKKIEKQLRKDISRLEKQARKYQGGFFRKSNYSKYSETMIEIREKTIQLRRLLLMAADQLKKMFLQMFGKKK